MIIPVGPAMTFWVCVQLNLIGALYAGLHDCGPHLSDSNLFSGWKTWRSKHGQQPRTPLATRPMAAFRTARPSV